jgi:profilin
MRKSKHDLTRPPFQVGADEIKNIIAILDDKDKKDGPFVTKAFAEGLHVGGERYVATRVEDRHVYGRKVYPLTLPPPEKQLR